MSQTKNDGEPKRGRGRPAGSTDAPKRVKKIKLKPRPETAKQDYKKKYGDLGFTAIYGFDNFTEELVKYLWKNPTHEFIATDPIEQKLSNFNRSIGSLPWSIYRWEVVHHVGFIEEGQFPVVVVAEDYWDSVSKLPNPHGVKLICLSHWEK
jgi:hypothetical protein